MTKDEQGVWSVTVGPLKPELYAYTFVVDGVPALDGRVARFHRDGSRFENILIIPGPGGDLYEVNDVPHGTLAQVWYTSPTLNLTRRLFVYTPPGTKTARPPTRCSTCCTAPAATKTPGRPTVAPSRSWTT